LIGPVGLGLPRHQHHAVKTVWNVCKLSKPCGVVAQLQGGHGVTLLQSTTRTLGFACGSPQPMAYVKEAFKEVSQEAGHYNGIITFNCKFEADHLLHSTVGWAERSEAQHSHESQSLGFATLSANLQNSNVCNQPNLPRLM